MKVSTVLIIVLPSFQQRCLLQGTKRKEKTVKKFANHTLEDMKVAPLKAGLVNQEDRKKQEMRFIFRQGTMAPNGLNQDFSFTLVNCFLTCAPARTVTCAGM